jgi:hypothetical protein
VISRRTALLLTNSTTTATVVIDDDFDMANLQYSATASSGA